MHKDDVNVLEYIKDTLGFGKVNVSKDKCVFTITNTEGICRLISIFDIFPLNSSKYLDYLNFKKAFELYLDKNNSLSKKELANIIVDLKNSMNTKRTNITLPKEHKITITKSWLLGFIEGDGSFFISRTDIEPVFSLTSSEEQLPLFEKIKEYLEDSLGMDKYSLFKSQSTKSISLSKIKAREIGKPSIMLSIKNLKLLHNYFIPFFENTVFQTKKGLDFSDFKLITHAVYKGSHNIAEIISLILKLSHTMNNYRLSTFTGCKEFISNSEKDKILNADCIIEYLKDGRVLNKNTNKEVTTTISCVYEIIEPNGQTIILNTLREVLKTVGVGFRTLKKHLDNYDQPTPINGYIIKRIAVLQ